MIKKSETPENNKAIDYEPMLATARFIDERMKMFLIKHYIEPYEFAKDMLIKAEINYPMTIKTLFEGLQELIKAYDDKASLARHLKFIGDLTCVGVNAAIAGEKLREMLLAIYKK